MDKWIPINGTYRGGIESLGIQRYLIPTWYQSLGISLPKVVFPRVDSGSTGTLGFGASQDGLSRPANHGLARPTRLGPAKPTRLGPARLTFLRLAKPV